MSAPSPGPAPRYSVVVTAHNAAGSIAACLRSAAAQDGIEPEEVEIVLVDDRSADGTAEAALSAGVPRLRLIRVERPAASGLTTRQQALATAFEAARGEIVLTLDADAIAAPGWLRGMVAEIEAGRADAVAGGVSFHAPEGWIGAWQTLDQAVYLSICRLLNALGLDAGVLFGNFAFRRRLFAEVGGYERIGYSLTEDLAFARALLAHGARIAYIARTEVEVGACESWGVLIERAKRVGRGKVGALSVAIGVWMVLLAVLALAAALAGGVFTTLFAIRYGLGAFHAAFAAARAGHWRLVPLAVLYEPLAIGVGLLVMARMARGGAVEWGGNRYET